MVIVLFHAYTCKDCEASMNSKVLFQDLTHQLAFIHDPDEREQLALIILQALAGITRIDILASKPVPESFSLTRLTSMVTRLQQHEPIQYIIEEAPFAGHTFYVNNHVLIPRPETEELVHHVVQTIGETDSPVMIDIGTGSGCIAVSIKIARPHAHVYATDISDDALHVATRNARQLGADVSFLRHNILTEKFPVHPVDIIVSNPPYITWEEKNTLEKHVINFEPHLALFASPDDPLVFYRAIASKGIDALANGGQLFFEINEALGASVCQLLADTGFINVRILHDINQKDRMVAAQKI